MMDASFPHGIHPTARRDAPGRTPLLRTPSEDALDRLARLAARVVQAPIALITLMEADRHLVESSFGVPDPAGPEPRHAPPHDLCRAVVAAGAPLAIADVRAEPRPGDTLGPGDLGIVAYAGVPLRGADGPVLGTLGVADRRPRSWSEEELDLLADIAASVVAEIELRAGRTDGERDETLAAGQRLVLEMLARSADPAPALDRITRLVEELAPGTLCSILLLDKAGVRLRHGAAPSLPEAYNRAVDGLEIGPAVGCCGAAAHRGEPVFVADIETDLLWADYRDHALVAGLRACWSTPFFAGDGSVLGTFAMYYREPRTPTPDDLALIRTAAHLAGIAVERQRAERAIRQGREQFRALVESVSDLIAVVDENRRFRYLSPAIERICGFLPEEVVDHTIADFIHPDDVELLDRRTASRLRGEGDPDGYTEVRARHRDGSWRLLQVRAKRYRNLDTPAIVVAARDITEQRDAEQARQRLEEQLRQAQKMEAIGRLAGGVAHDFNNLLTAIAGHAELLHDGLGPADPLRLDAEEIRRASQRAAALTQQLLAFSRKQILQPRAIDLNALIADLSRLLGRLIGKDIELRTELEPALGSVRADAGQIEQVVMNLVLNARDAMPEGGRLVLRTAGVDVSPRRGAPDGTDLQPGAYVLLSVTDSGSGMGPEILPHIFEPFFTTKERGKGTGLGLATVYGIVQQSGGGVAVESEVGRGTTFRVYLPRAREDLAATPAAAPAVVVRGRETLLLVEDEQSVRLLARRFLERWGYTVLEAEGGAAALRLCEAHQGPIHLLLTDVVMPEMNGRELARRVTRLRPGTPTLYMSGYAEAEVLRRGFLDAGAEFLEKPFTPTALAARVRDVLDLRRRA